MSQRVLYDTNVVLDVLLARQPFLAASAAALDLVAEARVEGFLAGHAVTTIAYVLQRDQKKAAVRAALLQLLSKLRVAATTDSGIRLALAMDLDDFEDCVTVACAQQAGCELIVTRNLPHFRRALVRAVLPEALVAGP